MTPLELARELDTRVEALLRCLAEAGAGELDYESELSELQARYLRARFDPGRGSFFGRLWRRLSARRRARLDRELFERALPTPDLPAQLAESLPPAPLPAEAHSFPSLSDPSGEIFPTGSEFEINEDDLLAMVRESRTEAESPAVPAPEEAGWSGSDELETNQSGEIDLSALLGAVEESLPAEESSPSRVDDGEVDLEGLLSETPAPAAVAEPATPEEMLGLDFGAETEEDDFDLQALLESSIGEPVAEPAPKARADDVELVAPATTAAVEADTPAPEPGRPYSRMQKMLAVAAGFILLCLVGVLGRYYWIYYQEHRPGGDAALYQRGVAYLEEEQFEKAANRLATLIRNYPESELSERAFFKYADALFGEGKYSAAVANYRRALRFQESRSEALPDVDYPDMAMRRAAQIQIARSLGLAGHFEDAADEYRNLLEIYARDEIARSLEIELADLYFRWGVKRGETEPLERAIGLYQIAAIKYPSMPDGVDWHAAAGRACVEWSLLESASAEEHLAGAREAFETALALGQSLGFAEGEAEEILARLARVGEALGDDELTASAHQRLLELAPSLPQQAEAYTGLARIEMRRAEEHRDEARRMMRRIEARRGQVESLPDAAGPLRLLAGEEGLEEKSNLLAAAFRELAERSPDAAVRDLAREGARQLEAEAAAYADALRYAEEVIANSEKPEEKAIGYYIRGDVAWQQGRLGDMVQEYQEALGFPITLPDQEERARLRIINYLFVVKEDPQEALKRIQEVLLRYPNGRYAYYARYLEALCHEASGQPHKAADAYAQVVLSYPESRFSDRSMLRDALFRLPAALETAGEYARAVQEYHSALEKVPDDPRAPGARIRLAECHRKTADLDRAVGVYRIFLEHFPDHPQADEARLGLADCYRDFYDFDRARSCYRQIAAGAVGSETEALALLRIAESYAAEAETASSTQAAALRAEAESALRILVQRFPASQEAYVRLADLAEQRDDWIAAHRYLADYLSAATGEAPQARLSLRLADLAGRRADWDEVLARLDETPAEEDLKPEELTRWHFYRAEALRAQGELEAAAAAYRQAQRTAEPQSRLADEMARKLRDMEYRARARNLSRLP